MKIKPPVLAALITDRLAFATEIIEKIILIIKFGFKTVWTFVFRFLFYTLPTCLKIMSVTFHKDFSHAFPNRES